MLSPAEDPLATSHPPNNSGEGLPEPSIPSDLSVQLSGFPSTVAQGVGEDIIAVIRQLSQVLPLGNLDGVTVAADYTAGLASVSRGFGAHSTAPMPTHHEDVGTGVAMALTVQRERVLKTHLVFGPHVVLLLAEPSDHERQRQAISLIAHELGHAVEHELRYRCFGELLFQRQDVVIPYALDRCLFSLSQGIWEEYFATRTAASLVQADQDAIETVFRSIHGTFRARIQTARREYNQRRTALEDFLAVVDRDIRLLLQASGNLFAINDLAVERGDPPIDVYRPLTDVPVLMAFRDPLASLWEHRGNWVGYSEFLRLNPPTLALLRSLSLYPAAAAGGAIYWSVPPA